MKTSIDRFRSAIGSRLLAGAGTLALLTTVGFAASRPGHSAGGPVPVTVANAPLTVKDINVAVRQPFQKQIHITTDASGSGSVNIPVPAGQRLIIDHINGFAYVLAQDDIVAFQLDTTYNGNGVAYEFRALPQSDSDHYHTYVNEPVLAFADPGSNITLNIQTASSGPNAPTADSYISVSGYLEKVP